MVINLKDKQWIILFLIIIIVIILGIYFFSKNKNNSDNNYSASKTSTNEQNSSMNDNSNLNNNQEYISESNNVSNNSSINNNSNTSASNDIPNVNSSPKTEEPITSFSTKIYTKDSSRQNNVSITCSTLNNTIVANGSTFSFGKTVGKATADKGYLEADIFDKDGNKKKGLGGGNCQVSTTLYNAVLQVPNLVVTERHEHSNKVPYIQDGKDAAVAYGSYDLKFRNDTGFDIRIAAETTGTSINIILYKI